MVITLGRNTVYVSHRAEAMLFEYIILIFSAVLLTVALLNFKIPKTDITNEVYSCFITSYEGELSCQFSEKVHAVGHGRILSINGKEFFVPHAIGECYSSKFIFDRGEIKCQ